MRRLISHALASSLAMAIMLGAAQAADPAKGPNPALEPPEVVQAMLAALKKNSDQGIAELYAFSSPGNKRTIGPLPQFQAMIREGFPDMLGHRDSRLAPPLLDGDRAMLPVEILGSDQEVHQYVFLLSRQSAGDCTGCWMADAVVPPEALGGPGAADEEPSAPALPPT